MRILAAAPQALALAVLNQIRNQQRFHQTRAERNVHMAMLRILHFWQKKHCGTLDLQPVHAASHVTSRFRRAPLLPVVVKNLD